MCTCTAFILTVEIMLLLSKLTIQTSDYDKNNIYNSAGVFSDEYFKKFVDFPGNSPQRVVSQEFQDPIIDDEWDYKKDSSSVTIPPFVSDLYESLRVKDVEKLKNADLIRILFEDESNAENNTKFNVTTLPEEEIITEAELYIYRLVPDIKTQIINETKIVSDHILRLYQILPVEVENSTENADLHDLLGVLYVPAFTEGWQVFNVRKALESWMSGSENLGFLLVTSDNYGNILKTTFFHTYNNHNGSQPTLVIYSKNNNYTKDISNFEGGTQPTYDYTKDLQTSIYKILNTPCFRHYLYIDFDKIGWKNFIIHPSGFAAYRCFGSCKPNPESYFTNYAKLTNLLRSFTTYNGRVCCVPNKTAPLTLTFWNKENNIVVKTYHDLIVTSCSCM